MKKSTYLLLALATLFSLVGRPYLPATAHASRTASYVEPALLSSTDEILSVIVTAAEAQTAAQAVERVGGKVTSDLELIQAVGARITRHQLDTLLADPGIRSITANKEVRSSGSPGWVTEMRVVKAQHALEDEQLQPATVLPDGGFVSVAKNGKILIVNADGSQRARVSLSGGPFKTASVTVSDGTIYVAGEAKRVYALAADGAILWSFSSHEKFMAGVTLDPDARALYAVDEKCNVYALHPATGELLWEFSADSDGTPVSEPMVGQDGTIYVLTEKGYLLAINPDGSSAWTFVAGEGDPFRHSPLIAASGAIYFAGEEKRVIAVNADGSLKYRFATGSKVLAQPALAADGSLYIAAEDRSLYGLEPDGTQRFCFRPTTGKFKTSPVISADGATVYAAIEEKRLYAVDAASGAEQWSYHTPGMIKASPVLDASDNLILGDEHGRLVLLSPDGTVVYSRSLGDELAQSPRSASSGDIALRVGDNSLVTLSRMPEQWDGRPDVRPTGSKKVWDLANPVAIDVGADVVHAHVSPDGGRVTGEGVTVAVLDTGVYFTDQAKHELGPQIQKLFVGQADFVGDGTCVGSGSSQKGKGSDSIVQHADHCFYNEEKSLDLAGHGSHVAGIVWNQFTDDDTGVEMGIAPEADILSVRVLGPNGGTYEDVIEGIQYVVANKDTYNIGVLNVSLSADATVPYFVDPLNRAVEQAWAHGIVVVAAAGNDGPTAGTITVPGNDPYVITAGAVDSQRTPGYWAGDILPTWSGTGPTRDGFIKPDVLAPGAQIISYMYNDHENPENSAQLVREHPDFSENELLFRMSGTSMAAGVTSGVVALMLQAHPDLTPDQIKYRLMVTARPAMVDESVPVYNLLQQGVGRIWAPDAVLSDEASDGQANQGMDIHSDLAHGLGWVDANGDGWVQMDELDPEVMANHYQGPVLKVLSDDGRAYLYLTADPEGNLLGLGAAWADDMSWIDASTLVSAGLAWADGQLSIEQGMIWSGGLSAPNGLDWNALNWGGLNWGATDWASGEEANYGAISSTRWVGDQ